MLKCWVRFMPDWLLPFCGLLFCVSVALAPSGGVWALRMVLPLNYLDLVPFSACCYLVLCVLLLLSCGCMCVCLFAVCVVCVSVCLCCV